MNYLSFEKYKELGGKIEDESTFLTLEKRAEYKLNWITQNRLLTATIIPSEVEDLMQLFVDMLQAELKTTEIGELNSYSNGVESFSYVVKDEATKQKRYIDLAKEYLATTGLMYRGGAKFDYL